MNSGTFSWPVARQLASFAALAYTKATAKDIRTNAQALVTTNGDGDIVVAFKGSSTPRDFLQDAKFIMRKPGWAVDSSPVMVHAGFLEDFTAIDVAVVNQIKACLDVNSRAKIYVTGHSLGGALAILCAQELYRQKFPIAGVYTFGQPRVGNALFSAFYDDTLYAMTYRIVNQNDIVPRTPGVLMEYRHCGQEIFLPAGGGWWLNPSWPLKFISDLFGLYGAYRNREEVLVREHFLQAYCEAITTQHEFTDRLSSVANEPRILDIKP